MRLTRRVPHGTRGLKSKEELDLEIFQIRRVPHGTRGLKLNSYGANMDALSRVPHGTRGLK